MTLLTALRPLLTALEDDIRTHSEASEEIHAELLSEHQRAKDSARTALEFGAWRDEQVTLAAVQWILGCVFIRFCEDNGLIAEPRLAGPGERLDYAIDSTTHYFSQNPTHSDRDYLLSCFAEARELPGMGDLFDPDHNPLYRLPPSVDGADELLEFWRRLDPQSGELALSFADRERDTRFLGDLYQDLSDDARKRYALLQTPEFIERFILERTLEPAIVAFGLADTDLIDPACGSGHFLLGAFERLLGHWREREPNSGVRELCQRALEQIAGVDINPFAVAICEFRLLVAALDASAVTELKDAPDFQFNLATGDSLLFGARPGRLAGTERASARPEHQHLYAAEDEAALRRILDRRYAAVVANPPYITPKDPAARDAYREIYSSCKGKYALSVPFMERLFELARPAEERSAAGFVGQITSNSFMKREFGTKLVEQFLPSKDLTELIDTSGAYIPGHGTPTVILIARAQAPRSDQVRAVLGIRGEPSTPDDPAKGKVWSEIITLVDEPGSEGEFVSCEELERATLATHPWSLQGGGALEVKELIEGGRLLSETIAMPIGFGGISGIDEIALIDQSIALRKGIGDFALPLVVGDQVRDWRDHPGTAVSYFPYDDGHLVTLNEPSALHYMWPFRSTLESRPTFSGETYKQEGRPWWEWHQVALDRYRTPLSITFAEVATHNHFVLDRGGKVFNRTAPVIKLREDATVDDHLELLGPLNSSIALFWGRQTFYPKGGYSGGQWENRLAWDSTKLQRFPLPSNPPTELARRLDELGHELSATLPASLFEDASPSAELLAEGEQRWGSIRRRMIALQEELDWRCYSLYGLIDAELTYPELEALPELELGQRAFEIALARRVAAGEFETRWFERHGSQPITAIPSGLPSDYQELIQRRLDAIERLKPIRLIERPEYKRRWQSEGWGSMVEGALYGWLCDRLEDPSIWSGPKLLRAEEVSDRLLGDPDFQTALGLYAGADADPAKTVAKLFAAESVPYLAAHRYKPAGLRKRAAWERTWELQRAEDRGERVQIDVPPKYASSDFRKPSYWRQRGKLDVPKERFTSYPGSGSDGSELYSWAGYDEAKRAQALAGRITKAQDDEGRPEAIVIEMLAGLEELLPWVFQWHPDSDPTYGQPLGEIYDAFIDGRCARLGISRVELGGGVASAR